MRKNIRNACIVVATMLAVFAMAQDTDWLKKNDRGSRYEGIIERPHALKTYELLGFFANRQALSVNDSTKLRVRFFLPRNEPAYVLAQEIRVEKQYLMRAKPAS